MSDKLSLDSFKQAEGYKTKFERIKQLNTNVQLVQHSNTSQGLPSSINDGNSPAIVNKKSLALNINKVKVVGSQYDSSRDYRKRILLHPKRQIVSKQESAEPSYKSILDEMKTTRTVGSQQTIITENDENYLNNQQVDLSKLIFLVGEHGKILYYDTEVDKWHSQSFHHSSSYQGLLKYTSIC